MGTIEIILAIVAIWAAVAVVFTAGFIVGKCGFKPAEQKIAIQRRHRTATIKPHSPVPGVDVDMERRNIIIRAKQEFNMTDAKAEKFADDITALGIKELGKLHKGG